jgi:hypothetical protein
MEHEKHQDAALQALQRVQDWRWDTFQFTIFVRADTPVRGFAIPTNDDGLWCFATTSCEFRPTHAPRMILAAKAVSSILNSFKNLICRIMLRRLPCR